MTTLIKQDTSVSIKKSKIFSTYTNNQPNALIRVSVLLGVPQIEITFDIDANISNKTAGKLNCITITNGKAYHSKEKIENTVNEATLGLDSSP